MLKLSIGIAPAHLASRHAAAAPLNPTETIFGELGDFFDPAWDVSNNIFVQNSGFIGTIFQPQVDGKVSAIKFAKHDDTNSTHTVYLLKKNGTGITTLATQESSAETATESTQTVTLTSPIAVSAGDLLMACYFNSTQEIPIFGLAADGQADFFHAIHSPWTNNTGHLVAQGNPDVNGAVYDVATQTLTAVWADFVSEGHFSNVGVDVVFRPS